MARAMQIPAALQGVAKLIQTIAPEGSTCQPRFGSDGRPGAAYKGGGWYFGVYFGGCRSDAGGVGNLNQVFTIGCDITRVASRVKPSELGELFMQPDELYEQISRVVELVTEGAPAWRAAEACNVALNVLCGGERNGTFYDPFDSHTVAAVKEVPADWLVARSDTPPPIYVCKLSFTGLKYLKLASEMQTT